MSAVSLTLPAIRALHAGLAAAGTGANAVTVTSMPTPSKPIMRFIPSSATRSGHRFALPLDCFRPGSLRIASGLGFFGSSPRVACRVCVGVFDYGENGQSSNREGGHVRILPARRTMWRSTSASPDGATIRRHLALEPAQRISTVSRRGFAPERRKTSWTTVIAEDASFVPGRQIRGELEAEDGQLAKEVSLVGEDGHDDVFNVRKRTKESVEVPGKMRREDGSSAIADDRERSVRRGGIVVDHQVPPVE